jgi:predicted DNA-binding transcriptional regulator YafY
LQDELGINERTLRRYLEDIVENFSIIVIVEQKRTDLSNRKTTVYRVINKKKDVSTVLQFFLENTTDLSWVLKLFHEQDPSLLEDSKEDVKFAVEGILHENEDIFLFRSAPFETMQNDKQKKLFATAKRAVKNHEYATITYYYDQQEILQNVKCLKMIYMHNNWYLAIEDDQGKFRFLRLAFVQTIQYADKITFQPAKTAKYNKFFENFQNAFSLPDVEQKIAYLRASNKIAKYFNESMKPFFRSQKFIQEHNDGSIEFSMHYTQALEVLPFIKQWLPDITIQAPQSLQNELTQDLESALKEYSK